jgi:hypothetical protein
MSSEPQKNIGQKLGNAHAHAHARHCSSVAYTCRPSVEPPPKSLRRSVERAYWGRRQPGEQATTIKTLVSGPPHCDIADPTWPASDSPSGVWSCDSGSRHGDSHATSIDF